MQMMSYSEPDLRGVPLEALSYHGYLRATLVVVSPDESWRCAGEGSQ